MLFAAELPILSTMASFPDGRGMNWVKMKTKLLLGRSRFVPGLGKLGPVVVPVNGAAEQAPANLQHT